MKIKDILSNDEIFELQKNQGKSTDEILQIARDRYKEQLASGEIARKEQAKLEYQKRNDLNAIKELNALKKEAIDKGASGAEIEQLQNNNNIRRYGTPEQKKQLEQAQNAVKIKQEIIDEAARNDEKYGGFSGGASRNLQKAWGNTLVGIGEAAKYLGIDSERLNRGTDYYKNAVEYVNDIDKSRQKQGLKTFSEHAGNFVGAIGGPGEVATLPFGFGKTALRTAGKFAGIELLGGTPRRIGESVTEPNSNLGFLEKSALESGLAGGFGGLLHGGYNLYKGLKGAKGTGRAETAPNTAPNGGVSGTTTPQNSNADDLATNGSWMEYSANTPQSLRKPNHTSNALRANLEDQQLTLKEQIEKTQESLKNAINKKRLDEAKTLKEKLEKAQKELGEIEKQIGFLDKERDLYPNEMRGSTFNTAEQPINSGDIKGSGFILQGDRKALPYSKLKTADDDEIIDLVPDENGVYGVAYNGSSKELAKIATEIAKGEIQSLGAKRLVYIADNLAETAAKDAEQKISANIAKIDDDSVELYANNTALLADIAKKYPMLNKDEQIELANKQILANASAELLEYSKFLNGGALPNDARLLGKNTGRMILKSLNAGAEPAEIVEMLIKAGISGRNSTAAKALLQTRDINAYNAQMRQGEAELIAELSQNVRVAAKNESIGAILGSAKEKALENDELLKKGVGNQGLDDVTTTFKSSKSGKEFEVAENGFGRELLSYDGVAANEEMKRAFLAWEAQEKKADITLHDGRKVVFLEPDEAVQLSYGNSYLYGEKDLEALFARRRAESLEQKLKRLQSHPAYENLLKMRENTKASELKGDTVGGSKPTVFYEPQSERYLRTQGGGGLPNAERSITITKADVAKLRAHKANEALATKLENNLEALTGDPVASGLIDELLTRDYHLASAAKKSELVAPKNADEVAGNSKIPSNKNAGMKAGFSTQALNELMLGLGSGGANAVSEDDPNKKAQAFIKGFLAGFGGAKAASMLVKNAPKLAPQLARASEKMASDLPRLLNDRPDILGGVLGRMNNAKDKFSFIFGGEKALGANKAKLKTARDMAKNGADESQIWAKTGWYKDIDKKWKFEINPKGGELDISALKKATPNKLGDILKDDELFKAYPQVKDLPILPTQTKDGADAAYQETEVFGLRRKAILFNDEYLQNATNDEIRSTLYHEIQHAIQSIEGFGAGGNTQKLSYQEYKNLAGESEARNVEKRLNRTYSKDDAIDGEFNRLLIKDMDNPKTKELKQKWRELILAGKLDEADKIKKQLDQRQEFLKKEAVKNVERFSSYSPHPFKTLDINPNDRVVKYDSGMSASMELEKDLLTSQGRVNTNALLKNASKMPKALSRDEFEAQFNANISGDSYVKTPIGDIKVNVEKAWEHFKKNTYNQDRSDLSGAFIHTLQDPLFIVKQNWKPTASPHTMGQSIAKSQNAKRLMDDRQREIITQSTIFFKPFSDENGGKYLASFAIDKNGELIQKTFYDIDSLEKIKKMIRTPENNVLYYKNARNQTMGYKDAGAGMRESFSPELKASYDMRDKLLKSTNEVRASLNEKGKAELEKLAGSKDSKLSRDAQIMKTLENAKSNPARYERLKKLYLDENGKVKDSIGLC